MIGVYVDPTRTYAGDAKPDGDRSIFDNLKTEITRRCALTKAAGLFKSLISLETVVNSFFSSLVPDVCKKYEISAIITA